MAPLLEVEAMPLLVDGPAPRFAAGPLDGVPARDVENDALAGKGFVEGTGFRDAILWWWRAMEGRLCSDSAVVDEEPATVTSGRQCSRRAARRELFRRYRRVMKSAESPMMGWEQGQEARARLHG